MIHTTGGIVLRTVKYGETSVICTIYTELFGIQSYLVNGVRMSGKSASGKAAMLQPAAVLELEAYHSDLKNLQRLKEFRWKYLYRNIFSDVIKHAVALFMVELFHRSLKQPEANADLFYFVEHAFLKLDAAGMQETANLPLVFSLSLPHYFGFAPQPPAGADEYYFDLQEGAFTSVQPAHGDYLFPDDARHVAALLKSLATEEAGHLPLNREQRRRILMAMESFYRYHIQDFPPLRTLPILRELMN